MKLSLSRMLILALASSCAVGAWATKYQYETVAGDPMKTMIYTLPNGLKIYMSVNRDEPRIQTNIAVRVGSKNDPAETTGLAHYFEHMMFKGTTDFGTTDYAAEKPMLDEIEALFETYRATTDSTARVALYHQIDSISFEASKIAIPNEYDKLMASIGANGTNAYTSQDYTCYVEDIPSNELDRWAKIQANRFEHPILRGFHTELETIYEEKNMSLTKDSRKLTERMFAVLFPNHPYGQWSVLGHQSHLKNPSLTNIKNYHAQWYVPNNMAVLLSGDFDPDYAVDVISRYFSDMKPNPNLPKLTIKPEAPITEPIKGEVFSNEAEKLLIAWRVPGAADPESETAQLVDYILANGKAGLIDLDINQKQKALGVSAGLWSLTDHGVYNLMAVPREGQSLEELQALVLDEFAKLRNGEFDEALLQSTINNFKRHEQESIESNDGRVDVMANSFLSGIPMERQVTAIDRQSRMTKKDITDFANKYLRDDNYVVLYKRIGKDTTELKIAKQPITPLAVNRDTTSRFFDEIVAQPVQPIEPVFVDFDKDLTKLSTKNKAEVLYKQNTTNDLFNIVYVFETGTAANNKLSLLNSYFPLLGTKTNSNETLAQKFYELACDYRISIGEQRSYIVLSGLSENMSKAMALLEDLLANAVPDQDTYNQVVARVVKSRADRKKNQTSCFSALRTYVTYGPEYVKDHTLSNEEMAAVNPAELTDFVKSLSSMQYRVIYYGPLDQKAALDQINKNHKTAKKLSSAPAGRNYAMTQPTETVFYVAPYEAKQLYLLEHACEGRKFDKTLSPITEMYNEYFGGGMNSVVFQEMRERRSLAYSAYAGAIEPSRIDRPNRYFAYIATQNDKLADAVAGFNTIINDMPTSQTAFDIAKTALDSRLRSERIIKDNVAWYYINCQDLNISEPSQRALFEALPTMTLDQVVDFQQKYVKGRKYAVGILGDSNDIDLDYLRANGKLVMLTLEDIFGY